MRMRWYRWVELFSMLFAWAFGSIFAVLALVQLLPALSEIWFLILLSLFLVTITVAWWFDMVRKFLS